MIKQFIIGWFVLACSATVCSQTIAERELDLSTTLSGEKWGGKKQQALELLQIDSLNFRAIRYLTKLCADLKGADSVSLFLDGLCRKYPQSALPYFYRVRLAHFEKSDTTTQIAYLQLGYAIDSANQPVIRTLGERFYGLFVNGFARKSPADSLRAYARQSIYFLSRYRPDDPVAGFLPYGPLFQLYRFEGNAQGERAVERRLAEEPLAFPYLSFVQLPENWKTRFDVDVMSLSDRSVDRIGWYTEHLNALSEKPLSGKENAETFRFLWLRTFHRPVAVRLEKRGDSVTLYWKECDGRGGYDPGQLATDRKKTIDRKVWSEFEKRITADGFWSMPGVRPEVIGFDGAHWLLEGSAGGRYHVTDRWGGGEIKPLCLFLLGLTDLTIPEEEIY